jgi:hypothetical protein
MIHVNLLGIDVAFPWTMVAPSISMNAGAMMGANQRSCKLLFYKPAGINQSSNQSIESINQSINQGSDE